MLTIGKLSYGQQHYYLNTEYYLSGKEPTGRWFGEGANELGLSGVVERKPFTDLFNGIAPDGRLVQNARHLHRVPGFDLTFECPKEVSVLWSALDSEGRRIIEDAVEKANQASLSFLEQTAAFTRRGKGSRVQEPVGFIGASFRHSSSREADPHLHIHNVIANICVRRDGTAGTIDARHLYRSKMVAGAIFRAELAALLMEQGLEIERKDTSFRLVGVPEDLVVEQSKRRNQIIAELRRVGYSGAKAAEIARAHTKKEKQQIPPSKLFANWERVNQRHGFTRSVAENLFGSPRPRTQNLESCIKPALSELTKDSSYFSERELLQRTAVEAQGSGIDVHEIRTGVLRYLAQDQEQIVSLGAHEAFPGFAESQYTTQEILSVEKNILDQADRASRTNTHGVKDSIVVKAMEKHSLNVEQREALSHITSPSSFACIQGAPGTGKTSFLLRAAREVWERQGYEVVGAASYGRAAKALQEDSGIRSLTLARLFHELEEEKVVDRLKRQVKKNLSLKELVKTAKVNLNPEEILRYTRRYGWSNKRLNKRLDWQLERLLTRRDRVKVGRRTILVIDEAGVVNTRQMERLSKLSKQGVKIVLIGDSSQLQAIEYGAPFRALCERTCAKELVDNQRQEDSWAREAVEDFRCGNARAGLAKFKERGLLHVADTMHEAMERLVSDWKNVGLVDPKKVLIFCNTREEVADLNESCQREMKRSGKLSLARLSVNDRHFHLGDRILFTRNHSGLGVQNGSLGTVASIDPLKRSLTVHLDDHSRVTVNVANYKDVELGYAVTTHKGQGATTKHAFVLAGGFMQDRESTYVQVSRAREATRIYTDRIRAGKDCKTLIRQMTESRSTRLAIEKLSRTEQIQSFEQQQEKEQQR